MKNIKLGTWFKSLYLNLSRRTERCDLLNLGALGLIEIGEDNSIKVRRLDARNKRKLSSKRV